jgi:hypothetical protein
LPSAACTPITSRCGGGCNVTPRKWNAVCARSSNRPTTVGGWSLTYIRVKGKWVYLYRAMDSSGATIDFLRRDIEYVTRQLELGVPMVELASYHPRARQRHQFNIRTFYGFRAFDLAACRLLLKEIAVLVRFQVRPKVIFWRCVDVLVREKIEVPSYTRLTKLIQLAESRACRDRRADHHSGCAGPSGELAHTRTSRGRVRPRQNQCLQAHCYRHQEKNGY